LGFTVSRGIVSYVNRELDGARWLQTDLPINDGNSGGPVINARGELVGMMSFILRGAQGMSFALPVNVAMGRFRQLGQVGGGPPGMAPPPRLRSARAPRPAPPAPPPASLRCRAGACDLALCRTSRLLPSRTECYPSAQSRGVRPNGVRGRSGAAP